MTPWQRYDITLDHMVVGTNSLDEGAAWLAQRLGVETQPGGKHVGVGTHNRLLRLGGGTYLELIAPDPSQPAPTYVDEQGKTRPLPLPFGLGDPKIKALLAERPRVLHYVVRTSDIEGAQKSVDYDCGVIRPMRRGDLNWRLTLLRDSMPLLRGENVEHAGPAFVLPTLIDWGNTPNPGNTLESRGVSFQSLTIRAPSRYLVRLAGLARDPRIRLVESPEAHLGIELMTPNGYVVLD